MAKLGSGTARQVKSFRLSRTACVAIALNADQRKPIVKAAKDYFTSTMNAQELATSVEGNVLIYRSSTGKVNVNVLFSQDTFQMEAPIDMKTGFNRHEKRLQRVKSKLFSLKPFNFVIPLGLYIPVGWRLPSYKILKGSKELKASFSL